MGVVIPLGFGQATIPFGLVGDSREMVVTLGFNDNDAAAINDIAQDIQDAWFAMSTQAASSIWEDWRVGPVRVVVNRTLGTFEGVAVGERQGTHDVITTLPQNCAYLVRKTTSRGGRAGRGRMYLPPCTGGEITVSPTGVIDAAQVSGWNTELEEFRQALITANLPAYLLHSPEGEGLPPEHAPDIVTGLVFQNVIATQRTRLRP